MRALTIEGTDDTEDGTGIVIENLLQELQKLPVKPLLRLCLEADVPLINYYEIAKSLSEAHFALLLQPVDSEAAHQYSISEYGERFEAALSLLGKFTSFVEVANEINGTRSGNWLGPLASLKMAEAIKATKEHFPTVVTLYLDNSDQDYLWEWTNKNPFQSDYVLLSNYPRSSPGTPLDISMAVTQLAGRFPSSKVGVGEYGSEDENGYEGTTTQKLALIQKFENRKRFSTLDMGLGFYWDFYDDCVKNKNAEILNAFQTLWK